MSALGRVSAIKQTFKGSAAHAERASAFLRGLQPRAEASAEAESEAALSNRTLHAMEASAVARSRFIEIDGERCFRRDPGAAVRASFAQNGATDAPFRSRGFTACPGAQRRRTLSRAVAVRYYK